MVQYGLSPPPPAYVIVAFENSRYVEQDLRGGRLSLYIGQLNFEHFSRFFEDYE